jgi:WD40 repeat protein
MKRMKTLLHILNRCNLPATCLTLAASTCFAIAAGTQPPQDTSATLQRLQEQFDQQTKRVDRLYRALGPQLAEMEERAAAMKKQQEEDAALAMKPLFRAEDQNFNSKLLFLPGSRRLALAGADRIIRLLALPQGKVEATLTGAEGRIECLSATADGKRLFAGTDKGLVFAWSDGKDGKNGADGKWSEPDESLVVLDTASGRKLWGAKIGRGDFQALSFAGDGNQLAVVQQGKVAVLDAATGQVLHQLAHEQYPAGPLSTAMNQDGNVCAVGYGPNSIGLWDARTGKLLRLIKAHSNWVVSLAFTPDGALLASSAGDTTASVWEVATGKEVGRVRFGDGGTYVYSVSISDDGHWLAAGRQGEYVVREMPAPLSHRTPGFSEQ